MNLINDIEKELQTVHIVPPNITPNPDDDKITDFHIFINKLGYPNNVFYDGDYKKLCSKYYNVEEYENVVHQIYDYMMDDKEVPQELINYMLKIKKIREKNNL